jgi:hypothetical protein
MNIVEKSVSDGGRAVFELEEFLSRPLYAHLAQSRESRGIEDSPRCRARVLDS